MQRQTGSIAEWAYTKVVIPAKAGIQGKRQWSLDSGLRRNDGSEARTGGYLCNASVVIPAKAASPAPLR
jgi:hypothetical protein